MPEHLHYRCAHIPRSRGAFLTLRATEQKNLLLTMTEGEDRRQYTLQTGASHIHKFISPSSIPGESTKGGGFFQSGANSAKEPDQLGSAGRSARIARSLSVSQDSFFSDDTALLPHGSPADSLQAPAQSRPANVPRGRLLSVIGRSVLLLVPVQAHLYARVRVHQAHFLHYFIRFLPFPFSLFVFSPSCPCLSVSLSPFLSVCLFRFSFFSSSSFFPSYLSPILPILHSLSLLPAYSFSLQCEYKIHHHGGGLLQRKVALYV